MIYASSLPVHIVASGDTLSALAERYLGDAGRWRDLYRWNADTIRAEQDRRPQLVADLLRRLGADATLSLIFPGTRLVVFDPESPVIPI